MKLYALLVLIAYLWNANDKADKKPQQNLVVGGWRYLTLKTDYYRSKIDDTCLAFGRDDVEVVYGEEYENDQQCYNGATCYNILCTWYKEYGYKDFYVSMNYETPYFRIWDYDGGPVYKRISDPCIAHTMCGLCEYGDCVVDDYEPTCECDDGYSGDYCDEKDNNNVIIAVTVLGGVLALIILCAIVIHLCWKKRRLGPAVIHAPHPIKQHPQVNLVNTGPGHFNPAIQGHVAQPCGIHRPAGPQVSLIENNGAVSNLDTYVRNGAGGYVGGATTYVNQSCSPTVITNMPQNIGTAFSVRPSPSVIN